MRATHLLLVVSLALVAVLTWQVVTATAGHRALADRVLHDYADLAAMEVVRRGSTFLFTYGFDVGAQALARAGARGAPEDDLPSLEAMAAAMPAQSKRAIELVGARVRVNTRTRQIAVAGDALPPGVDEDLVLALQTPAPTSAPSRVVTFTTGGRAHVFAFTTDDLGPGMEQVFLGFEARLDAAAVWLRELVQREPLLPPSIVSHEASQSALSIVVSAPDGRALIGSRDREPVDAIAVVRPWLDEGSRRALAGFNVISTIDPSAASNLIIGGLPRSRLGPLLVMLILAGAAAAVAVVQMGRERALAELRHDFVTRTSHELRTPVARIRIFTDTLLLDRVRSDEERREAVHAIDRAARRLSLLVENVLRFSRKDTRPADTRLETADLAALVREAAVEFETTANAADRIIVRAPPRLDAAVDVEGIRQALLNLLDNAWKYSGSDRPIHVDVSETAGEIRIRIADAGPGIPAADRGRVWEPYVRLDRDRRSSIAGTGIGLAVVKDIVNRHRGRCWIEGAESGGAAVTIALPIAATNPEKATA